jgi:L-fucose isomerase-like protein
VFFKEQPLLSVYPTNYENFAIRISPLHQEKKYYFGIKTAKMDENQMMDQMEQHLAKANEHSKKLRELVRQAKTSGNGITPELLAQMAEYQKAWTAEIERHNAIAKVLFGNK